nr:receptor tyrosine-protein kinase erbB-2-like isoform X2 [Ciona intestinalis]|eukprot:XP_026695839.1 receptor tyrosine-protein kinase erbB-2-like isoform X2 [Ciona intestinalis]
MTMNFLSTVFFVVVVLWQSTSEARRRCYGVGKLGGPLARVRSINSTNIGYFEGCEVVKGTMIFRHYAFRSDPRTNTPAMNASQLQALNSIKVITGFLFINAWAEDVTNFSAFKNLKKIKGKYLYNRVGAVVIQGFTNYNRNNTLIQIESLGFGSLKSIDNGNVYISQMVNLCYDQTVNWLSVVKNPIQYSGIRNGVLSWANKPRNMCNLQLL